MYRSEVRTFSVPGRIPDRVGENLAPDRAISAGPSLGRATVLGHAFERLAPGPIQRVRTKSTPRRSLKSLDDPLPGEAHAAEEPAALGGPPPEAPVVDQPPVLQAPPEPREIEAAESLAGLSRPRVFPAPEAVAEAESAFASVSRLPVERNDRGKPRALVVSSGQKAFLSGGSQPSREFLDAATKEGLEFQRTLPPEVRSGQIGHSFTNDQPSTIGASWHADPRPVIDSGEIGDSLRMCNSCQGFTLREAIASGRTKTVRDPNFLRSVTPWGPNAASAGGLAAPLGAEGFGRALVSKSDRRPPRVGKPTHRFEQAIAFPGSVTVAEQEHRPGQAIVRVPSTARLRVPADVGTSDTPTLFHRPPRASLGQKGAERALPGEILKQEGERRKVLFRTPEGHLKATTEGGSLSKLKLVRPAPLGVVPDEFQVTGGPGGLVTGAASAKFGGGPTISLPELGAPPAPSEAPPDPAGPPPLSPESQWWNSLGPEDFGEY